jgi:putative ATPase
LAIKEAIGDVKRHGDLQIPGHLLNAPTDFHKGLNYGSGYVYAHDDLEGAKKMTYLPKKLSGRKYYLPKEAGSERQIIQNLAYYRPIAD